MNTTTDTLDTTASTSGHDTSATDVLSCSEMQLPPPGEEHEWLQKFVGDWDLDIEMLGAPDQPPMKSRGRDQSRMIGGFWLVSEGRNDAFPYVCRLTLGFDPELKKYVGTWIDSMSSYLWHYVGSVDASGRILTLETEGPFPPMPGGALSKFREVTEFKTDDHRVYTSSRLAQNGEWIACIRINFHRRHDG